MRIAFITDLHANREAVSAVMAHARAEGAQRYVLLGDYVGYGADPGWVVDLVQVLVDQGAVAVIGNHDQAVVRGSQPTMVPDAKEVIDWTRARLTPQQLRFLAELPMSVTDGERLYVHANAFAPESWVYVDSRTEAALSLQATACRLTFCGHMHNPMLYHLSATDKVGEFMPAPGTPIPLSPQRQWLAIPGSAGQPRDGNPAACYAMFDEGSATLTFHRVPYDYDAASEKIRAAGLPQRIARRLAEGD
jgi:diadenosine tetraphosphatase ApaH/serine/threonine PP2A family protein phosphatase